ncbi:MAG: 2-aminoethylphosphonate--pyruvate transaminase [Flavobacteriales bacterium]|nr:2-aminoethylphosphonate--pyruvate transaminase [Flavobacteriales bacterium]
MSDKLLFTPGPLTTSLTVKQAMLRDLGSRDHEFIALVRSIRSSLIALAEVGQESGYDCVIMQGAGTFGIETVISSAIAKDGHLLLLVNGAYGKRMAQMARIHGIRHDVLECAENEVPSVDALNDFLNANPSVTHIAAVHCETTTGILNPIQDYGAVVARHGKHYFVDAMSSFGGIPIDMRACHIDFLVSSSNKCIEGVPGFSFILASKAALLECEGRARSLSLDLFAQWKGLENDGQFRFTPPTHALLAYHQAISELHDEGGVEGRAARYAANHAALSAGMASLGFEEYLPKEKQTHIITTFRYPKSERFDFKEFYDRLNDRGLAIYPGKLTQGDCFRIGNIGRIYVAQVAQLVAAIREVKAEMGF